MPAAHCPSQVDRHVYPVYMLFQHMREKRLRPKVTHKPSASRLLPALSGNPGGGPSNERFSLWDSIFLRIIILFLLSLLPIYALVIFFFSQGRAVLAREINSSMQTEVANYLGQLETEIVRIRRLAFDLVNDEDLNRVAVAHELLSAYEQTVSLNRLQRRLIIIRSSSAYIETISVHLFPIARSINASTVGIGSISEIDPSRRAELLPPVSSAGGALSVEDSRLYLLLDNTRGSPADAEPLFSIQVEFSTAVIRAALDRFAGSRLGSLVLFDRSARLVIASGGERAAATSIPAAEHSVGAPVFFVDALGRKLLYVRAESDLLGLSLAKYVPEEVAFRTLRVYTVWVSLFTLVIVLIVFPFAVYSHAKIRTPLMALMAAFSSIENGELSPRVEHQRRDEFGHLAYGFNRMAESLGLLLDQVAEQRNLAQRAELRQLQSQINPHFLYNSYFLLHRLIKQQDTEKATAFSRMMGRYFEVIARGVNEDTSLDSETEHARIYADIQAIRFEGRIAVEFGVLPPCAARLQVPPLILQPIIENAFEHGLEDCASDGLLRVSFDGNGGDGAGPLIAAIEDNGTTLDDGAIKRLQDEIRTGGIGMSALVNIHRRIELRFGPGFGLRAERSPLGGLRMVVVLPRAPADTG